jgi:hypothetical protein
LGVPRLRGDEHLQTKHKQKKEKLKMDATIQQMPFDEYLALPGVNWSSLKHMRESPLHYRHELTSQTPVTAAMNIGTAAHTMILEPDRAALDLVVWEGGRRYGKKWDAFCEANTGKTIVNESEYSQLIGMRDSVRGNEHCMDLLKAGTPENVVTWNDPYYDIPCKARIDWWDGALRLVDLKTTQTTNLRQFASKAARLGYHNQLAYYRSGLALALSQIMGKQIDETEIDVSIIAVEQSAPYDCVLLSVTDDQLYPGLEENIELLALLADCEESGNWRGRYQAPQLLELPAWVYDDPATDDLSDIIN